MIYIYLLNLSPRAEWIYSNQFSLENTKTVNIVSHGIIFLVYIPIQELTINQFLKFLVKKMYVN